MLCGGGDSLCMSYARTVAGRKKPAFAQFTCEGGFGGEALRRPGEYGEVYLRK